jgi:hypothetical protein
MNKWMILCMLSLLFLDGQATLSPQSELKMVEEEIRALKKRLHQDQLREMKEEVGGQGLMIADWDAYAQELQLVRKQEEEDNHIQMQIQNLELRKAQLLKQHIQF